jgi:hypothetical protein
MQNDLGFASLNLEKGTMGVIGHRLDPKPEKCHKKKFSIHQTNVENRNLARARTIS